MLSLKEKYEAKLRRTEKYWLKDAKDFFFYEYDLPVNHQASLIFASITIATSGLHFMMMRFGM